MTIMQDRETAPELIEASEYGWRCSKGHITSTGTPTQPNMCVAPKCSSRVLMIFTLRPPRAKY